MSDSSNPVATRLLFENGRLRVWEMSLAPGEASDWHRHHHDYVFINLTPAQISLEEPTSEHIRRGLDAGFVEYVAVGLEGQPPHRLLNAGASPLKQVLIELLGPSETHEPSEPETNGRFI